MQINVEIFTVMDFYCYFYWTSAAFWPMFIYIFA